VQHGSSVNAASASASKQMSKGKGGGKRDDSAPLGASEDELEHAELEKNAFDPSRQFVFE
jgi:hypothetical protein